MHVNCSLITDYSKDVNCSLITDYSKDYASLSVNYAIGYLKRMCMSNILSVSCTIDTRMPVMEIFLF